MKWNKTRRRKKERWPQQQVINKNNNSKVGTEHQHIIRKQQWKCESMEWKTTTTTTYGLENVSATT